MNRVNAEQMRKSHEMVAALNNAGILFVPMPVIDDQDLSDLFVQADNRLEQIAEHAVAVSRIKLICLGMREQKACAQPTKLVRHD